MAISSQVFVSSDKSLELMGGGGGGSLQRLLRAGGGEHDHEKNT